MKRDFTYIDDVVEGIKRLINKPPVSGVTDNISVPYRVYNIGNNQPVTLLEFVETIEKALGKTAEKNFLPMQSGDVPLTYADIDELMADIHFSPSTSLATGIQKIVEWYREYYPATSDINEAKISQVL